MFEKLTRRTMGGADDASAAQWGHVTVGLVGHCGPDTFGLTRFVKKALPGATVEEAHDGKAANALVEQGAVLLVNRVLDGRFHTDSGVELIREMRARHENVVAILISNLEDAQQDAAAAGAQPGFGKGQLKDESAAQRLREAAELVRH